MNGLTKENDTLDHVCSLESTQLDYIKLAGGTVYDPSNGVDGQRKDIWVAAGQVIEAPETTSADSVRTIDADGMVVMPGGVDMHCHIAGPKVNAGRKMQPEQYAGQEVENANWTGPFFTAAQ